MTGIGMTSMRSRQRLINQLREAGITDEKVLEVMLNVPRHEFIEEALASYAYDNSALPIGYGQTISQPLTVAIMTSTLREHFPKGMNHVLEIGTGCGYQAAVLAPFAKKIVSIERISQLHRATRKRLLQMRIRNVLCLHEDGFMGYENHAPYDAILAAAASDDVPQQLLDQLAEGGRIIMPLKHLDSAQQRLVVIDKTATGLKRSELSSVSFVPRKAGMS